jgi:MFS family permease
VGEYLCLVFLDPLLQLADHSLSTQYLILSGAIGGIGTGCWYVAEAGAIMTLAPSGARGKYLALWIVSRNLGQLVGGAIK